MTFHEWHVHIVKIADLMIYNTYKRSPHVKSKKRDCFNIPVIVIRLYAQADTKKKTALKNPVLSYPWQDYDLYNVITMYLLIKMNEPITLYFKYMYVHCTVFGCESHVHKMYHHQAYHKDK